MSKEIQFRGKSTLNGQWLFGSLVDFGDFKCIWPVESNFFELVQADRRLSPEYKVDDETIGQYIGIKGYTGDYNARHKNEVYLFEGDIVEAASEGYRGTFCIKYRSEGSPTFILWPNFQHRVLWNIHGSAVGRNEGDYFDSLKVIGNIYDNPDMFSEIKRAWAVWVLSSQSFSSQLDNSWGYDVSKNTTTKKIINNRDRFTEEMAIRLQNVQIECADALYIIKGRDSLDSFFYLDPPYFNSDCGHYDGYSEQDFENLLFLISNIQGKFLMSSYPSALLKKYCKKNNWNNWMIEQNVTVNHKSGNTKKKIEVLTANFNIDLTPELFENNELTLW